jgi:hypothetical protein
MDPMTIASLVSAGSQLFGAVQGARQGGAASNAQSSANNIALLNWLQNRDNADFQRQMATAGQVDARGNRTAFVPGVGFVATPSTFTRGMQDVADAEAIAGYAVDQPRVREEQRQAFLRRLSAGADAEAARAGRFVGRQDMPDVQSRAIELGFAEADSGADAVRDAVGVNAIRTGTGGEQAIAGAARTALANRRTALARARAQAPGAFAGARDAQNTMAENAIASPMRRASGQTTARLQGGTLDSLNGGASAELASRFLARGGQVEAPRLGYADDRTGIGIAGAGRAFENLITQGARAGRQMGWFNSPQRAQADEMDGVF